MATSNNKPPFETPTSSLTSQSNNKSKPKQQQQQQSQLQHHNNNHHQQPQAFFEFLPDLCLDKILNLLEPQDLRSVHQVSKAWQNTLRCRPRIDSRRIELVTKIRLNKENIAKGSKTLDTATPCLKYSGDTKTHDGKPGSRTILRTVCNSRPSSVSSIKKPAIPRSSSTPTSRFLQEYEAGSKLLKGQVLFRCPECSGPVPSPSPVANRKEGFRRLIHTTPYKMVSTSSSSSGVSQSDSGFESIEVSSTDQQFSSISLEEDNGEELKKQQPLQLPEVEETVADEKEKEDASTTTTTTAGDGDISTEEISMSFIATPQSSSSLSLPSSIIRMGIQGQRLELGRVVGTAASTSSRIQEISSTENVSFISTCNSSSSSNSSSGDAGRNESITECPKCSHRFCCNCKCTEHPGRPCKEITGDSLFSDNSNVSTNENNNLKSKDKAKRSKKDLRRLARV